MQLSVPNRTAPKSGSFNSKTASVKRWIDRLPMANIGATTRLLFEALHDLNYQDIPAQQRFKALELLHKPVDFVTDHMKKHFVGQPLPLAASNLRVARLSREITHTLATGYKVLVMEQIAGIGRRDRKLLITALHRATRLLSSVLLKAYQVYEPYPDSVWLEIHSLYRYAEANDLHTTPVAYDYAGNRKKSTAVDAYKQIRLLALACPYRLRQTETESIYQALEQWAPYAELQRVEETATSLFVTNLDSDQPPSYLVLREAGTNRNTCRAINTARLAEQLRKALAATRAANARPPVRINAQTLRHLMLAWGVMPKRRHSRVKDGSDVVVSVGLSSVHYFVSGEAAFNNAPVVEFCPGVDTNERGTLVQEPARFQARDTQDRQGQLPDVWEMNYRIEGEIPPNNLELAVARAASGLHIDTSHRAQNWKMVNVSAGGYCLLWDNPEATRAQVGELLGIREERDPDTFHWRLGVIRWLKCADEPGLELGVQMLSPGADAIAARPENMKGKESKQYTRGLLLPEIASIQQQATLLLPSPPFKHGDTAIANCQGQHVLVRLTKLVENTGSFAQFQFVSLGELEQRPAEKPSKNLKPADFSDVWDML